MQFTVISGPHPGDRRTYLGFRRLRGLETTPEHCCLAVVLNEDSHELWIVVDHMDARDEFCRFLRRENGPHCSVAFLSPGIR